MSIEYIDDTPEMRRELIERELRLGPMRRRGEWRATKAPLSCPEKAQALLDDLGARIARAGS